MCIRDRCVRARARVDVLYVVCNQVSGSERDGRQEGCRRWSRGVVTIKGSNLKNVSTQGYLVCGRMRGVSLVSEISRADDTNDVIRFCYSLRLCAAICRHIASHPSLLLFELISTVCQPQPPTTKPLAVINMCNLSVTTGTWFIII